MKSIRMLLVLSLAPLASLPAALSAGEYGHENHAARAAGLTKAQVQFLANYENIRAALAADDLEAAKRAAAAITDAPVATQLTKAPSLNEARTAFRKLSGQAVMLVKGQAGYYVASCPMAGDDWVQTTAKVSNPYLGEKMPTCGSIKD